MSFIVLLRLPASSTQAVCSSVVRCISYHHVISIFSKSKVAGKAVETGTLCLPLIQSWCV